MFYTQFSCCIEVLRTQIIRSQESEMQTGITLKKLSHSLLVVKKYYYTSLVIFSLEKKYLPWVKEIKKKKIKVIEIPIFTKTNVPT